MSVRNFDCPLCERHYEREREFRGHLLGQHRKSELVDLVLERDAVAQPQPHPTATSA